MTSQRTPSLSTVVSASGGQRLLALDSLRGICALLVALHHFKASGFLTENLVVVNGFLFVDFFFVLSGYVIAMRYWDTLGRSEAAGTFLAKRFARLYPLFIATLVPWVLFELLVIPWFAEFRRPFEDPVSLYALVLNILMLNAVNLTDGLTWNYPSWSISAEMFAYGGFAVVVLAAGCRAPVLLAAMAAAAAAWLLIAGPNYIEVTSSLGTVRGAYGFCVGALLWRIGSRRMGRALGGAGAGLAEVSTIGLAVGYIAFAGEEIINMMAPLVFAPAIMVFSRSTGPVSRILQRRGFVFLGTISYSIYLVHAFFASRLYSGSVEVLKANGIDLTDPATGLFGRTALVGTALTISYLCAIIVTSTLTFRYVERPGQYYLGGLFGVYRPTAEPAVRSPGSR